MIRIVVGTIAEITARMAGAPSSVKTTIEGVISPRVFSLANVAGFTIGSVIVIGKEKAIIQAVNGNQITIDRDRSSAPNIGAGVRFYNADYTKYRDLTQPFSFVSDQQTGGSTGDNSGSQNLVLFDWDGLMCDPVDQNRITIYDSANPSICLFGGMLIASDKIMKVIDGGIPIFQWQIVCQGYQWESSKVGIIEDPFVNVNAGVFIDYLRQKWTNLSIGQIDKVNSPTIDYIRLASYRQFSDICNQIAALWPGSEFFIQNNHTGGAVYFRKAVTLNAPIVLNQAYLNKLGSQDKQYADIRKDNDKIINIIRYPYYKERTREPDFHVQDTVTDTAFLRTSVILAGQPSSLEEATLFYDDFTDGQRSDDFIEYDVPNPNPPNGYNSADGFLIEGELNTVPGFHLVSGASISSANPQPVGRLTDPGSLQPFTGEEGQMIFFQEFVVDTTGHGMIMAIMDQTTIQTPALAGSTASSLNVASNAGFNIGDIVTVNTQSRFVQSLAAGKINLNSALGVTPSAGAVIENNRLSKSRVQFGLYFKPDGVLTYIREGVEFSPAPWTYQAVTTYSFRLFMQAFESIVTSATANSLTLQDVSRFAIGDVINIFSSGSRVKPEVRVITGISGNTISYAATLFIPKAGYRVRTLPKIVLQAKGGGYGDILGRNWTTLYTDKNTWQKSATVNRPDHGIAVAIHQLAIANGPTLQGTFTSIEAKNRVPIFGDIGNRHLMIGNQESDSSDPDIDCIVRKVGSHYQLDFFPDTKALWPSASTMELRYNERFKYILNKKDLNSIRDLAIARGYAINDSTSEQELIKLGGMAYDDVPLLPTPLSDVDALNQSDAILKAGSSPAFSIEIASNSVIDTLCSPGQLIKSELPGVPDMVIQQVEIKEAVNKGPAINTDGSSAYYQTIRAGTIDRLSEILRNRNFTPGARLVLDDGKQDDSFTNIDCVGFTEAGSSQEAWDIITTPFEMLNEDGALMITEDNAIQISG